MSAALPRGRVEASLAYYEKAFRKLSRLMGKAYVQAEVCDEEIDELASDLWHAYEHIAACQSIRGTEALASNVKPAELSDAELQAIIAPIQEMCAAAEPAPAQSSAKIIRPAFHPHLRRVGEYIPDTGRLFNPDALNGGEKPQTDGDVA